MKYADAIMHAAPREGYIERGGKRFLLAFCFQADEI
jgi:hypothetical protein